MKLGRELYGRQVLYFGVPHDVGVTGSSCIGNQHFSLVLVA